MMRFRHITKGLAICLMIVAVSPPAYGDAQSCNENGYVITEDRGHYSGAKTYLGKSCDAFNAKLGKGHWCWANGGIMVEIAGKVVSMAHRELYCEHPALNSLACGCHQKPLPSWRG